jgi:tetratricopeptide (TPR) repeat protein
MLTECHDWSERALRALPGELRGGAEEMHLQAASGLSLMFTQSATDAAGAALRRSLAIAEERGDTIGQLKLLASIQLLHTRLGEFKDGLRYARRSIEVAKDTDEPAAHVLAHSLLGNSLHFAGDLSGANTEFEAVLRAARSPRASALYLGFDHHNRASIMLARNLWLQGYPDRAVALARQTVAEAAATGHPVTLYLARIWALTLFLWTGDLGDTEELTDQLTADAESHSIGFYVALGRGFGGALAVQRGDPRRGVENLQGCLDELHPTRYELLTTTFNVVLVEGLADSGRPAEGLALIDETIRLVDAAGDLVHMPELLRLKSGLLQATSPGRIDDAEACLLQSLEWSRRQGARAWELRAATDLAALWAGAGRRDEARALLQPVLEQFEEGLEMGDLKAAIGLLTSLT